MQLDPKASLTRQQQVYWRIRISSSVHQQVELNRNSAETQKHAVEVTSRTKRALLNSLASVFDYASRLLVGFLVKPILVFGLGKYGYGAWEVLGRLAGFLSPATGQAGHALRWTTAHQQESADYEEKRRSIGSAVIVCLVLTPVICIFSIAIAWGAPYLLKAPADSVFVVRVTALLLAANVAATSFIEIPRAVLEGENLGYKRMGVSAALVCLGGLLTAGAVWLDFGLAGVAAASIATSGLMGAYFLYLVRVHVSWFGIRWPQRTSVKNFFCLSGWYVGWHVVLRLMRTSDVVLLGLFSSVELVTAYSLTRYAPEVTISLVGIVVFSITPGLGGIIGANDLLKAARIRAEVLSLTWLIATVAGVTTLLWNPSFLHLWVGREFYAGTTGTLLMVLMVTQFVLMRSDANIIDLTLDLRNKVILGLVSALMSITIASLLVARFDLGIEGMCVGIIAGRTILSVAYPWIVGRFLSVKWTSQVKKSIRPCLTTATLFFFAVQFESRVSVDNWATFFLGVSGSAALVAAIAYFVGLCPETRLQMWRRIQRVVRR